MGFPADDGYLVRSLGSTQAGGLMSRAAQDQSFTPNPSFFQGVGAVIGRENSVLNVFDLLVQPVFEPQSGYRVSDEEVPLHLAGFMDRFEESKSAAETRYLVNRMEAELRTQQIIGASGTGATIAGYLAAGVLSPESWIPFGAAPRAVQVGVKTRKLLGLAAISTRGELGRALAVGGMVAATEQTITESLLRQSQFTRSLEESEANVAGALVFGSILGGFGHTVTATRRAVVDELTSTSLRIGELDQKLFRDVDGELLPISVTSKWDDAEWARRIQNVMVEADEDLKRMVGADVPGGSWVKRWWARGLARTPVIRGAVSDSLTMRLTTDELTQTALLRKGGGKTGKGLDDPDLLRRPSIEAETTLWAMHGHAKVMEIEDLYREYRKAKPKGTSVMSRDDFFEAVTKATRRVETDAKGRPTTRWAPQQAHAEALRGVDLTDLDAVHAIQQGVVSYRAWNDSVAKYGNESSGHLTLSELYENSVTKTASSYVQRIYSLERINADRDGFRALVRAHREQEGLPVNEDQITAIIHQIEGTVDNAIVRGNAPASPLEDRTLMYRDDFAIMHEGRRIAVEDFLENDLRIITARQIHSTLPRMALVRRMGTPAHKEMLTILPQWEKAYRRVQNATDSAELRAAVQDLDAVQRRMNDMAALEIMEGQATPEMAQLAEEYRGLARARESATARANSQEAVVEAAELEVRVLASLLDRRRAFDIAQAEALQGPINPVRAQIQDAVELAERRVPRPKATLEAEAGVRASLRQAKADLEALEALNPADLAEDVAKVQTGVEQLTKTVKTLRTRLKRLKLPDPQVKTGGVKLPMKEGPKASTQRKVTLLERDLDLLDQRLTEWRAVMEESRASGPRKELATAEKQLAATERELARLQGVKRSRRSATAINQAEEQVALARANFDAKRQLVDERLSPQFEEAVAAARKRVGKLIDELDSLKRVPGEQLDIDAAVLRVWQHALRGERIQGTLSNAYKLAREIVMGDEKLKALANEARAIDPVLKRNDLIKTRAAKARAEGKVATAQAALEDFREQMTAAGGRLFEIRDQIRGSVRDNLTAHLSVNEPRPLGRIFNTQARDRAIKLGEQIAAQRTQAAERLEGLTYRRIQIDRQYEELGRAARSPAEAARIDLRRRQAQDDLTGMVAHLTGLHYQSPDKFGANTSSALRKFNFITKMGGMTISSTPDIAMSIFVAGFIPWAKMAVRFLADPRFKSFSKDEIAHLLIAAEMTMGSMRLAKIGGIEDLRGPSAGSILDRGTVLMSKLSLMDRWNAANKAFASVAITQRGMKIMGKVRAGQALTGPEDQFLQLSGISRDMADRIYRQFERHGETERIYGLYVRHPNSHLWHDDVFAREVFEQSLVQNVNRTVVTPGIGELPLFGDGDIGRLVLQFRSFSISASQQVVLSGAQRFFTSADYAVLSGVGALFTMGLITQWLKTMLNEGPEAVEEKLYNNPANWAVQGIDRSGLPGIASDVNAVIERMTGGRIGMSAITGEQSSRFSSRNLLATMLGPSMGQATSLAQLLQLPFKIAEGDLSRSDVTNVRRMVPYNSLFYLRGLLDSLGPKAVTGESKQIQDWLVSEKDIEDINSAIENLWQEPVLGN